MPENVHSQGSGPEGQAVEARLTRVEPAIDEIRKELIAIRADVVEIKSRVIHLPTMFQLIFLPAIATVATFIAATALSLLILRIAAPH